MVRGLRMDVEELPDLLPWAGAGAVVCRYALVPAGEADPFTGETATEPYVAQRMDVADALAPLGVVAAAAWADDAVGTLTLHAAGTPLRMTKIAVAAAHHAFVDRPEDAGPVITAAGRPAGLALEPGFVPVPLWVELTKGGALVSRFPIWVINRTGRP
jgi:hypothetical protein